MRETWIDECKGLTIFCVVMAHIATTVVSLNPQNAIAYKIFAYFAYTFIMPLFFFASGYCFSLTTGDKKTTFKMMVYKEINIVIPYVIFTGLYYITHINMGIRAAVAKYWFCPVLAVIMFIVFFIKKAKVGKLFCILIILSLISGLFNNTIGKFVFYFAIYIGGMWAQKNKKVLFDNKIFIISGVVWCIYGVADYIISDGQLVIDIIPKVVLGMVSTVCLANVFLRKKLQFKVLSFVGKYTMIIYFVHMYIWDALKLLPGAIIRNAFVSIGGAVIACALPIALQKLLKLVHLDNLILRPGVFLRLKKKH